MKSCLFSLCLTFGLFTPGVSNAADFTDEPEVRFRQTGDPVPKSDLKAMAWFEGLWVGSVFGGRVEHRVMSAHDGHMAGLVRLRSGETDELFLYELSSFSEVEGTLTYRNRLFDPALDSVDEGVTDRTLVAIEDGVVYFDGITFMPDGPDRSVVAFVLTDGDGQSTRHVVHYQREDTSSP